MSITTYNVPPYDLTVPKDKVTVKKLELPLGKLMILDFFEECKEKGYKPLMFKGRKP